MFTGDQLSLLQGYDNLLLIQEDGRDTAVPWTLGTWATREDEGQRKKVARRKQAEMIIAKFDNLLDIGVTESDALSMLGIDQKKLDKARSILIV